MEETNIEKIKIEEHREDMNFNLELRNSEQGIICNAKALKEILPTKLKKYKYVVTLNNRDSAAKDRATLNKLIEALKRKRIQFEEIDLKVWTDAKKVIMGIEKELEKTAAALGVGIKSLEENEKKQKMEDVQKLIDLSNLPVSITFEQLYNRTEYDKKAMTLNKIEASIQAKIDKVLSDYRLMKLFLPEDEVDKEQVKAAYCKNMSIDDAQNKAESLAALRKKLEEKKKAEQQIKTNPAPLSKTYEATGVISGFKPTDKIQKKERKVVEFVAKRDFFDAMNMLIKEYKPTVKIIESEVISNGD